MCTKKVHQWQRCLAESVVAAPAQSRTPQRLTKNLKYFAFFTGLYGHFDYRNSYI